jgi:hypothetical protein
LALCLAKALILHQKESIKVVLVLSLFQSSLRDICGAIDVNHGDGWSLFKMRPRILRDS